TMRARGTLAKPLLALAAIPVDPARGALARDTHPAAHDRGARPEVLPPGHRHPRARARARGHCRGTGADADAAGPAAAAAARGVVAPDDARPLNVAGVGSSRTPV